MVQCGTLTASLTHYLRGAFAAVRNRTGQMAGAARTVVASLSLHMHVKAANLWRDLHNPLRGLTMQRAVTYLEDGERGAYADLQWLYRYIEKRDAVLRGGKRSLLGAVTEMDWDIKTVAANRLPAGCTPQQAEQQARTLRTAYDRIRNLPQAIEFLALAEFRGFSHLELIQDAAGALVELRPVEQWYWVRDGLNGDWKYNRTARAGRVQGEDIDPARFIIREIDDPINEIALIAYVRKQLGRKDEDGFIESFGIPSIFAIMPQNVPAERVAEYQQLAEQVIGDSRGALPHGSDIKTVDAGARGVAPFRAYQEALDKEIVMAITSGQLTMLAEAGSGTLAGGAHSETFQRVARSLARRITADLQAQLDLRILQASHTGEPVLAYFEILANEETDVGDVVKDVQTLKAAGYEVDDAWLREKTAYPVRSGRPAAPALPNRRRPGQDDPEGPTPEDIDDDFLQAALDQVLTAQRADFTPVAARLQALLQEDLTDDELRSRLLQLREELPSLAGQVAAAPETVLAWQAVLGAALGNELTDDADDD